MPQKIRPAVRSWLPDADDRTTWVGFISYTVAIGVAYYLAAHLSLYLLTKPDGVAVFWPAAGVSSGALIAFGRRARWPVSIGTMAATVVANLTGDRDIWSSVAFAVCNAGEALLAAWLIQYYFGPQFSLNKLRHVLGLLVAASVGTAASGVGGTAAFIWLHEAPKAGIFTTWEHWFAADAVGIITVAPLVIGLASVIRKPPPLGEVIRGGVALAVMAAMSGVLILAPFDLWKAVVAVAVLFPLLMWPAARCQPVFAAAASFIVTLSIVWAKTFGLGYFDHPVLSADDEILGAQISIVSVALCALVLAALFAERREHDAAIEESEARLQEALMAGEVTAFDWDIRSGLTRRSANAAQILGFDPNQNVTKPSFLTRVHRDDRERFKSLVRDVRPDKPSYTCTFRFVRYDGREMWLEEVAKAEFDAAGGPIRIRGLTRDITERKRAEDRQNVLMAELDHRVRNVLSRVAVVAVSTRKGSRSMDEFVLTLRGRIQAMATAHALLSQSRWQGVDLPNLIRVQLAPYTSDENLTIGGPDVTLSPAATQAMAMVLHELVTNAAKYGALSAPGARVSVSWKCKPNDNAAASLIIEWRELGGPPIATPVRSGYGTNLIRELIPHELGGTVDLMLAPEGVSCEIVFPLERE